MVQAAEESDSKLVRLDEASALDDDGDHMRLSECISDLAYDVRVSPNIETLKMGGQCKLSFKAVKRFAKFFVHMKALELKQKVKITASSSSETSFDALVELDESFVYDTYSVKLPDGQMYLSETSYVIEFRYEAPIQA